MDKNTLFMLFGKWINPINFLNFQEEIVKLQQDKYVKKLTTKAFLLLMLHAQLHEKESLRAISDGLLDEDLQAELGLDSISASQLSRKNNEVDPSLLSRVFLDLVQEIQSHRHHSIPKRMPLKIIDSSTIPLNLTHYRWAEFRKTKSGVKLHLRLVFADHHQAYPDKVTITNAREHDRNQLEVLVDDKNVMYVFDRGYMDYKTFDYYFDEGIFFASRLKKNAVVRILESFSVTEGSPITSDSMVVCGTPQSRTENVFRLIETVDTKGNQIRILTNRFDISAEEIGEIYRSRWAIELFFKWLKQHVRIKKFYGMSETALQNQIYIALITYCLLVLLRLETDAKQSLLQLKRWLQVLLWKSYESFLKRIHFRKKQQLKGVP
ncbi:IS4 family transposase [Bacillus horti]|uniref:IS4 transposase n=1 Tax=Caldalkalibacillus horti TaxID=77523 RepID=A0ABT9W5N2_9BACI|nr:IS4 family transposase [Bacillus horti]MDQ0168558.1 IS4 transposase [Bacillus horti]